MNIDNFGIGEFFGVIFLVPVLLWEIIITFKGIWSIFEMLNPRFKKGKGKQETF